MPETYRFPVFIFTDVEGSATAVLLDYLPQKVAVAQTPDEAVDQLKRYVSARYRQDPDLPGPEFFEPRLIVYRVEVRPEYHADNRLYACGETIALRVPCVYGRDESRVRVCILPTLDVSFHYYEAGELKGLVTHYVQAELKGLTPQQLSRRLGPESMRLSEITVRVTEAARDGEEEPDIEELSAVAEPLGDPQFRRLFSKPHEREQEVEDLKNRLGKESANVLLVGEPGVGKTAILVEAVRKLERKPRKREPTG